MLNQLGGIIIEAYATFFGIAPSTWANFFGTAVLHTFEGLHRRHLVRQWMVLTDLVQIGFAFDVGLEPSFIRCRASNETRELWEIT